MKKNAKFEKISSSYLKFNICVLQFFKSSNFTAFQKMPHYFIFFSPSNPKTLIEKAYHFGDRFCLPGQFALND